VVAKKMQLFCFVATLITRFVRVSYASERTWPVLKERGAKIAELAPAVTTRGRPTRFTSDGNG
jgi:hypothetical protein